MPAPPATEYSAYRSVASHPRLRRQLFDRRADRDAAAPGKCLRRGRQHLVVAGVAAAFLDEGRARLHEQVESLLGRGCQCLP